MTKATKPVSNRIALAFDFDDTLVPDTVDSLLESCDIDSQAFRQERIQPLINNGWEPILARFYSLIQESKRRDKDKITQEYLTNFGRELAPFDGVLEMFKRLRQSAKTIVPDIEVEFYWVHPNFAKIPGCDR